jgi:hypothetical protein
MKEAKPGPRKKAAEKSASKTNTNTKEIASSEPDIATQQNAAGAASSAPQAPVVDREPQLPATHGKVGVFGGPKDRGIKPDDKLALPTGPHGVYERIRSLNPKSFYCAMRWNYHVEHLTPEEVKRWWANRKLLVTNSKNGNAVIVRAVDFGPHEKTGLDISVSPGAAEALGVEVGDEVDIASADSKSPLGPIS